MSTFEIKTKTFKLNDEHTVIAIAPCFNGEPLLIRLLHHHSSCQKASSIIIGVNKNKDNKERMAAVISAINNIGRITYE